ncbi:hypothetical protein C6503_21820 [Candidatus Poribacteria bacterium]|nr:MAG: hypothetical protein C6503_21820 [Candidatus Poribacteria bacterium]
MLKKFWIPVILCVLVILAGCDSAKQMMETTLIPEPTTDLTPEPTTEQPPVEPSMPEIDERTMYPEITFENVLDLEPGVRYRMRPTSSSERSGAEGKISSVHWGSIDIKTRELREGFTDDDPKIFAAFYFVDTDTGEAPFAETLDGKKVIERDPVWDEIVIEILWNRWGAVQETGGPRGNRFEFTLVEYNAILIENLTHPDRKIEYE